MSPEQIAQRAMDEYGYLVLRVPATRVPAIGEIIRGAFGPGSDVEIPAPLACIGYSTEQEWLEQAERYGRVCYTALPSAYRYVKAIAE